MNGNVAVLYVTVNRKKNPFLSMNVQTKLYIAACDKLILCGG